MATTKNKLFASAEKKTTKKSTTKKEKELELTPEMDEELSNGRGDDEDEEGG